MALAIGIDVGGTKTAIGVVDCLSGRVLQRHDLSTPPHTASGATFVAQLAEEVAALRSAHGPLPVGTGLCELVTPQGLASSAYTVDWLGVDTAALGRVESDVRAAALAEARFGRGRGVETFVYLNIGTGVSYALVLDGRPLPGARGAALVCASGPVPNVTDGRIAGDYIVENLAGGAAIAERYRTLTGTTRTVPDVVALAESGEPTARQVVDLAADLAGSLVAQAVNWLDPAAIVLGGSIATLGGRYGLRLRAAARAAIWSAHARDIAIDPTALGRDAGLIGAALSATTGPGSAAGR